MTRGGWLAPLALAIACSPLAGQRGRSVFVPPTVAAFPERSSVRAGERVAIFVRAEARTARIDVVPWRGGGALLQPREVEVPRQPEGPNEATAGCAWTACATIEIPADAPSDVYLVRVRADGETAAAPLVVRAARPGAGSRAVVLHPEAALAGASEWGGASLFPSAYGPAVPVVSLRRPLFGDAVADVASGAFLDWLGVVGQPVEHASDLDLARDEALLDPYDLVLFPHRHPYWTAEMRAAIDAFVRNGGRVLVLGGGVARVRARLEDRGTALRAHAAAELDPYYDARQEVVPISGAYAHGPIHDPEDRSFGLAARHAEVALAAADGFGYLRAHAPDHPFLRALGATPEGLFGRRHADGGALVAFAGPSDGANLERLDGRVLASRASGAPSDLQVLATAPGAAGFACIAEHRDLGLVTHLGSDAIARDAAAPGGLPDVQALLATAVRSYAAPRRSLIRNGGFERWRSHGEAWTPVGFRVAGAPVPARAPAGGDLALAGDGESVTIVWQDVAIPTGDVHLVAWTATQDGDVRLDVGNGFVLADAAPAGRSEIHGGYRYVRAAIEEPREAYLTCELPRRRGARIDRVEVVPEAAWRRELALDWRVLALGSGETLTSDPVVLDGGAAYLVAAAGFGRGDLRLRSADGGFIWRADASRLPGEVALGVLRLPRPGATMTVELELYARTYLTDVEVAIFPLNVAANAAPVREVPIEVGAPGPWSLPADGVWDLVEGVAGHAVALADERIAIDVEVPGEPSRITLWTRGVGTLDLRLLDHRGGAAFATQLRASPERWTPHLVRVPEVGRAAARLELSAVGPVAVDRPRLGSEHLAVRDDHLPNGAFELVPAPAEAAREATDWHDRPPGWSVSDGALSLDPVEPWRGDHALRIEPLGGRAVARLAVPDPLRINRSWRVTLAARAAPGARAEVTLLVAWPGVEGARAVASRWLVECAWSDVALGATADEIAAALDALRAPHRRADGTALARIEIAVEGGPVWIDDLTLDQD
jgi:hypothetical protein